MRDRNDTRRADGFEALEPRVLFNGDISILPLGDSITASSGSNFSYRYYLWERLVNDGVDFDFVGNEDTNRGSTPNWPSVNGQSFDRDHEGHSGHRVDRINDKLPGFLSHYTPDIALVHLGTNDIIQGQSASSTADELRTTIALLRQDNPDVTILLSQIIPLDRTHGERVDELNALLPGIVNDLSTGQSQIVLVDQNTGFDVDDDTYDGIHPDRSGEELMALRFYEALDGFLDSAPSQNSRPNANAGADQTLTDSNNNGTVTFRLDGGSSSDSDGSIASYVWRINGSTVGTGARPSVSVGIGTHSVQLTVTDNNGSTDTDTVTLRALAPTAPPQNNTAPSVNAGPDRTSVTSNGRVTLSGSVSDADGDNLSTSWSVVSAPGSVSFANASSPTTQATLTGEGTYVLRLTANDGQSSRSDNVEITIISPTSPPGGGGGGSSNNAPSVNAGPDRVSFTSNGRVTLAGSASDPDADNLSTTWSVVSAPGTVVFADANDPRSQATLIGDGVYVLRLTASDGTTSRSNDVEISINPSSPPSGGGGGGSSNSSPQVNAGPDRVSYTSNGRVTLAGSASDVDGDNLTTSWSVISAPGGVVFADATDPTTQATLSGDGVFVLRLTVSDGTVTRTDDVEISINPTSPPSGGGGGGGSSNSSPQVNAGPDRVSFTSNGRVTLAGSASDPDGDNLTTTWSVVSASGTVAFANASDVRSQATLTGDGDYVLRLTVSDGTTTRSDDVRISINPTAPPPGGGSNTAPSVNAGPSRVSVTNNGRVTLAGSVSDPDGDAVTTTWSVVSSPGAISFDDINAPNSQATLFSAGTYILRLTASDGNFTRTDDVSITIQRPV
ncbi:PKD domain-containing protein [Phycisphaeraceae bacterium D3-23]